ncbi:integral membrane protein [Streptomyces sp. e14]|nr:integral membrane protein [Streptomyces sp. e14]
MIACPLLLCVLGLPVFVPIARTLNRAAWPEREPVLGLWVWQCLVATALLSCLTALALSMAAVFLPCASSSSSSPQRRLWHRSCRCSSPSHRGSTH